MLHYLWSEFIIVVVFGIPLELTLHNKNLVGRLKKKLGIIKQLNTV